MRGSMEWREMMSAKVGVEGEGEGEDEEVVARVDVGFLWREGAGRGWRFKGLFRIGREFHGGIGRSRGMIGEDCFGTGNPEILRSNFHIKQGTEITYIHVFKMRFISTVHPNVRAHLQHRPPHPCAKICK